MASTRQVLCWWTLASQYILGYALVQTTHSGKTLARIVRPNVKSKMKRCILQKVVMQRARADESHQRKKVRARCSRER